MSAARVAVVGVGGTGCALLPLLYRMPVLGVTLIDGDVVEEGNLPRQPLYTASDVGRPKVRAAMERSVLHAKGIHLLARAVFLDARNAFELLEGHTVVADCTDDLHARRVLDAVCERLGVPLVSGAVHGQQLQVLTLGLSPDGVTPPITRAHFFPGRTGPDQDGCDMRHVPAEVTTMTAALMAQRIRAVLNGDASSAGWMDLLDLKHGQWMRVAAPLAPDDELIASAVARGRRNA
jgi:adenylyltransferase/sulfurtransferase